MSDIRTIELDYKKAKGLADELEKAAKRLQKEYNRIDRCKRSLKKNWEGENAESFIDKMERLEENIDGIVHQLKRSADTITENAQRIYEADKKAAIIAEMSGSNSTHVISR